MVDEANWLTLSDDLSDIGIKPASFDAVVCLGNSFAHLPDFEGDQSQQKLALGNFMNMVKPGATDSCSSSSCDDSAVAVTAVCCVSYM